jgi:hypothetical protein
MACRNPCPSLPVTPLHFNFTKTPNDTGYMQLHNALNQKSTYEICPIPVSLLKNGKYDISQSVIKINLKHEVNPLPEKELNQCMALE